MLGKKRNKEKESGELLIQHIFPECLAYMLLLIINAHKMSYNHGNYRVEGHMQQKNLNYQIKNFVLEDRMKGNGGQKVYAGF